MWDMLIANLIVVAILVVIYFAAKASGPALCAAWLVGFFYCYFAYGCHKRDKEKPPLTDLWQ